MLKTICQTVRPARVILGLTLLLAGSSCKKVSDAIKPKLPEATQEGKGTLGCLMDGDLWLTRVENTLDTPVEATYSATASGSSFSVRAEQQKNSNAFNYLYLRVNSPAAELRPGTYALAQGFSAEYEIFANGTTQDRLLTGAANQGTITFTKVEPKVTTGIGGITVRSTIVSGTFQFTATSATTGKTIAVQDGRFDVQAF